MTPSEFLDLVQDATLRHLGEWWLGARRGRLMPSRRDIDPIALKPVLARIWLMEFVDEPRQFRYRLAGEEIQRHYRTPLRGRLLSEVMGEDWGRNATARLLKMIDMPAVQYAVGRATFEERRDNHVERLVLPLADEAGTPRYVIGATRYGGGVLPDDKLLSDLPLQRIFLPVADWA